MRVHFTGPICAIALAVSASACFGGHRIEQALAPGFPNLGVVSAVDIRDDKGQVLLSGKFATVEEKSDQVVRRAKLTNPANDDWEGLVEIRTERDKDGQMKQDEILLIVDDLPDDTNCIAMFDTLEVTKFMTNDDGKAEVHLKRDSLARAYN